MTTFYINAAGDFYHGDMVEGDREATPEELAVREADLRKKQAAADIRTMELEQLLPRAVREFVLSIMEERATPEDLARLPAYVKLKAFDTQIAALRAVMRGQT